MLSRSRVPTDDWCATAFIVLPNRRARRPFLQGGVAGNISRAAHSDHSPGTTFRSVIVPALMVVPPKERFEGHFVQGHVNATRASAGCGKKGPALVGRVNIPALLVIKPKKRSGRYFAKATVVARDTRSANRDCSPEVVSQRLHKPVSLVVTLDCRSEILGLHGGVVLSKGRAVHRDWCPTVLTQGNIPVMFAVPPATSSERCFSQGGTIIVRGNARVVHSRRPRCLNR